MKKIFVILLCFIFLFGCRKIVETSISDVEVKYIEIEDIELMDLLNNYIAYISSGYEEAEIIPPYQFEDFLSDYNNKNRYIINVKNVDDINIICGYLSIEVKDILDDHYNSDKHNYRYYEMNPEESFGNGLNGYFKQYSYCAHFNCINASKYKIKWVIYNNIDDVVSQIDNMFLIYLAKKVTIDCENYDSKEKFEISMYSEEKEISKLKETRNGFAFSLLDHELKCKYILPYQLFQILEWNSLGIEKVDNKLYVNTNHYHLEERMKEYKNNYIIVDNDYCYQIEDIERVCNEK